MSRYLNIFDFDSTLFRSPENTPESHKKYEKATGMPWLISKELSRELTKKHKKFVPMRTGWWGRAETLEPPLVPVPAPAEWYIRDVCDKFLESKANPDSTTIIMTGRHGGLRNQVYRILDEGKLVTCHKKQAKDGKTFYEKIDPAVECYFLGDDGPCPVGTKPTDTFGWKAWMIDQFIKEDPEIENVFIWEDRDEHAVKFQELGILYEWLNFGVIHVK